jgi:MEDS: MEthanogen/methylotroph, DcmR Sensory domain
MTTAVHRTYRHEALLYRDLDEFVSLVAPFVLEGVELGQPVMVAVTGDRLFALTAHLGSAASQVTFLDMARLGRNPACIIPAWLNFVNTKSGHGIPVRGVGEPIWASRSKTELEECQLHEGLLNLAVSPDIPLWLVCPYNVTNLPEDVLAEAHRSHPIIVERSGYRGSTTYGGAYHASELFKNHLTAPATASAVAFDAGDVGFVQDRVAAAAVRAGVSAVRAGELAWAVLQLAMDSVHTALGPCIVRWWTEHGAFVVDIADQGVIDDPLVGRRPETDDSRLRRSLHHANNICDLVQVRSGDHGTVVRVHTRTDGGPALTGPN